MSTFAKSDCSYMSELLYAVSGKKNLEFSLHNFNKFRKSFIIFHMNHPDNSFYYEKKFILHIIISLCSADVIMTSLETTLSSTAPG